MTESINNTYNVHYVVTKLAQNNFCIQLIIGECKSKQMILKQEGATDFLKFASRHGFIADRIAF